MTARLESMRVAGWCPTCQTWEHDDDGWADKHTADTGHTTHRRTTTIETIDAEADDR